MSEHDFSQVLIMKNVKIGEATVKLLRLRELVALYAEYLRKDPDLFYRD